MNHLIHNLWIIPAAFGSAMISIFIGITCMKFGTWFSKMTFRLIGLKSSLDPDRQSKDEKLFWVVWFVLAAIVFALDFSGIRIHI